MKNYVYTSERLGFRQWLDADIPLFHAMCSDLEVMEFFPNTLTLEDTIKSIDRFEDGISKYKTGFFAVDLLKSHSFIGFIGIIYQMMDIDFAPCYEIGWRLDKSVWGQGLATEGALASLDYVHKQIGVSQVFSMTPIPNKKSERIMQKIGMQYKKNFFHPKIEKGHWLEEHLLYELKM